MRTTTSSMVAFIAGCLCLSAASLQAGTIITSATKVAGNGTAINLASGGLVEGALAYSDRTHTLVNIPDELEGDDLIQVSNSDKGSNPYQLDVTVGRLSALYVALDDRFAQPLPWMSNPAQTGLPTIFFDTGVNIDMDENADGSVNNTFSLWATIAPPGTYHTLEALTTGSNYVVFGNNKLIPEPTSMTLGGMGLAGLLSLARRRRS